MKKINISKQLLIILSFVLILIILLANISIVSGLFSPKNSTGGLELNISTQYNSYLLNQSIWLKVALINNTNNRYHLKSPINIFGVRLKIIKPDQTPVPKGFSSEGSLMVFDSLYLPINDSLIGFFNLDLIMGDGNLMSDRITGDFKIKASYQEIESNELIITTNLPTGEDKKIFDETFGADYPFSNDDQSRKLENLLNQYGHGPYSPQLYKQLFVFSPDKSDTTRFLRNFENYFKNNFNDFGSIYILNEYKTYLQSVMKLNENDVNAKLEGLQNKYRGTFIEECITNKNFEIQIDKFKVF